MREKIVFRLTIISLAIAGVWGLWLISVGQRVPAEPKDDAQMSAAQHDDAKKTDTVGSVTPKANNDISQSALQKIEQLILNDQPHAAAESIDAYYSEFSSDDLTQIKLAFLQRLRLHIQSQDYEQAQTLLISASSAINDIDIWKNLAAVSVKLKDWQTTLRAQLKSAELEIDPQQLEATLVSIVASASQLRAGYDATGDEISIKNLYQKLHGSHPGFPRFQLELAQSYLRLDRPELALPLLEQLKYDADLGELATQKIASLNSTNQLEQQTSKNQTEPSRDEVSALSQAPNNRASDIIVPLRRVGNSFLVNTSINGRPSPLLLDTGASITALSSDLIARLKLEPTGRSIRLNTANGTTQAKLYHSKRITLGQLSVSDLIVAEIDLGRSAGFQGLLGTDLLNRINTRYSYLIDNQQNALIFRRR